MLIKNKQSGVVIAVGPLGVGKRIMAYTVGTERMSKGDVEQVMVLCGPPGLGFDFDLVNRQHSKVGSVQKRGCRCSELDQMVKRIEDSFEKSDEMEADMVIES